MKITVEDFFHKIQNAEIQTEPFDHLVIDNFLPDDFYKELSKDLDNEDFSSNYEKGEYGVEERFGVDITDYCAWIASGCKISTTIHQANYDALFSGNISTVQFFVDLILKNEKKFYSLLGSKLSTERLEDEDNSFFHVSMVKDSIGYNIGAHHDAQNIFTFLFYMPETDVNREFGLTLYKVGGTQIDFIPNRVIIFAPSAGGTRSITWHRVDELSEKLVGTRNSFQFLFYRSL